MRGVSGGLGVRISAWGALGPDAVPGHEGEESPLPRHGEGAEAGTTGAATFVGHDTGRLASGEDVAAAEYHEHVGR